jgi:xanthine dehydrogenase accessory factor
LGNKLAISARGEMAGSVSGGCVEGAVFEEAQAVLAGGPPKLLYYGIADDTAWNVGLTCGGEIWVWLEAYTGWPVPAERTARVTVVEGPDAGHHLLVTPEGRVAGDLEGDLVDAAVAAGQEAIERERNATVEATDALIFAEALVPPPRLVVVGAVDTAESLCRMAHALGWRTAVVDPRGTFATVERVPSRARLAPHPGEALRPPARERSQRGGAVAHLGAGRPRHRRAHAGGDGCLDPRRGDRKPLGARRRPADLGLGRHPRDRREPRGSRRESGVLR